MVAQMLRSANESDPDHALLAAAMGEGHRT